MNTTVSVSSRICTMLLLSVLVLSCHRRENETHDFIHSLRCGMTKDQVIQIAHRTGYKKLAAARPNDATLLDLTFHEGKLVAVRVEHRTINLCRH